VSVLQPDRTHFSQALFNVQEKKAELHFGYRQLSGDGYFISLTAVTVQAVYRVQL